jgi:8-oxo-dGTP diphosphatase
MAEDRETHFEGQVAVKVVISCHGQVLLVRGLATNEPFDLPGGHLHSGELPQAAIVREVKEELGITVNPGDIFYSTQFFHPGPQKQTLLLVYEAEIENTEVIINQRELSEVIWVSKGDLDTLSLYPVYRDTLTVYFEKYPI